MFVNTLFYYDGVSSADYDLVLVKLDTGMFDAPFSVNQEIVEESSIRNDTPFFARAKRKPLEFELTIAKTTAWDESSKEDIVSWLYQGEYKPFQTADNLNVVYYCMPIGASQRFDNGSGDGYITIKFRCDSPYPYKYPETIQTFDLTTITEPTIISMTNSSNIEKWVYPEIEIISVDGGTVQLLNAEDTDRIFIIDNLQAGETVYVDNRKKRIETDVPSIYRLGDFNKNWLRLNKGENLIEVTGKCTINLRVEFPIAL